MKRDFNAWLDHSLGPLAGEPLTEAAWNRDAAAGRHLKYVRRS